MLALVLGIASLALPTTALAHLTLTNGAWTFRYFSKEPDNPTAHCQNGTGSSDPVSIIVYQYGEFGRIFGHLDSETHFFDWPRHTDQYLCGTVDGANYSALNFWDNQIGHGLELLQAHFRLWYAPHGHSTIIDKWSVATPHHERVTSDGGHAIDEDWETWEQHMANEMNAALLGHHSVQYNTYFRYSAGPWRGFYQSGFMTRIGGLHDGAY